MPRALVAASSLLLLLAAAPAAAQPSYDSPVRVGLGLDYGGLAGRGDGDVGGLRLQLGARLHDHFALYWQLQILGGAFVQPEEVNGIALGWNAAIAELSYGIFQLGAGPSVDVRVECAIATGQDGGLGACGVTPAPGRAARAGLRFGAFTISGDLHVSFEETGPDVWVLAGIGMQLGAQAREPMRFAASAPEPEVAPLEGAPIEDPVAAPAPIVARASTAGRRLDDPVFWDPPAAPEPVVVQEDARALERAPVVRRFDRDDVASAHSASPPAEGRERRASSPPAGQRRGDSPETAEDFDALDGEVDDDPIGGLDGL